VRDPGIRATFGDEPEHTVHQVLRVDETSFLATQPIPRHRHRNGATHRRLPVRPRARRGPIRTKAAVTILALVALAAACETDAPAAPGPTSSPARHSPSPSPDPPPHVRVAFLQELHDDGARERALAPFQGAELAFAAEALGADPAARVDLVPVDLAADPDAAAIVADDPSFVAAIVGPEVRHRSAVRELTEAGLAVVDLSPFGRAVITEVGAWRRPVPTLLDHADELARIAEGAPGRRRGLCLLEEPTTAIGLLRPVLRAATTEVVRSGPAAPGSVGDIARETRCRIVVFDGDEEGAASAARDLAAEAPRTLLLGGDRLRHPPFLSLAGRAAEGAISVCGCLDLTFSTELAAQRFVQDLQSAYGGAPGPYAVEGWDAAGMVIRALGALGPTRGAVTAWIATVGSFEGLGGTYTFDGRGQAEEAEAHAAVVRGGRWVALAPAP